MNAKKQDDIKTYLRVATFFGFLFGPLCGYLTKSEFILRSRGTDTPKEMRLADLAGSSKPENIHVRVTDFALGPSFVAETKGGAWQSILIPIFPQSVEPRGGNLKVIFKSSSIKDEEGLRKLGTQPALTGVIVNDVAWLGNDQKLKLSEQYTFADVGSALILEDRAFPTTARLALYVAGSAVLLLAGVGSLIGYIVFTRKTRPQEFPFLEGSAPTQ
jgi:hypothetical protein